MNQKRINEISQLIYRQIVGLELTEAEQRTLDEWRGADARNEATYQRLLDEKFRELENRRLELVDVERPLREMKSRIGTQHKQVVFHRWTTYAAVALALVAVAFAVWSYYRTAQNPLQWDEETMRLWYAEQIHPGQTQATLTLEDGSTLQVNNEQQVAHEVSKRQTSKPRSAAPRLNTLKTPRGGEFKITLEDGTEVWLNADSKLTYPESFGAKERKVALQGEAYFKVAKDSLKPFLVESDGPVVRVYGTEFNVCAYEEDRRTYTTLVSGSIGLLPEDGSRAELKLTPGCQALYDKERENTYVHTVNAEVVTSWRKGVFVFEEFSLEQIMQTLSRWYDFTYEFRSPELKETVFMGTISRYADFKDVLEILEKSGKLRLRLDGRHVTIESA